MSVLVRGVKNAVRNPVRAVSVIALLGVAMAFALSLLLANQAVKNKVADLKTSGGSVLTIMPAGAADGPGAAGGGEPLTAAMLDKVKGLEHVSESGATLSEGFGRVFRSAAPAGGATAGPTTMTFQAPESKVKLDSPIDAGTLGRRNFSGGADLNEVPDFKLPVRASGVSGNLDESGKNYVLAEGEWLPSSGYNAVVGKDLAIKNNLSVGSTFTAYDQTFKVVGIYDGGSTFANAGVLMPLTTFQTLTEQTGEVSTITVKVDSLENIDTVEAAIKNALGSSVDVSSSAQNTQEAIASLKSIQKVSLAGVVIAVIAASAIVFMVMVMIVRERKKEIAVLKAIGGSNLKITGQFVTEAVVLTLLSVVIGSLIALASSNSITKLLVTTNSNASNSSETEEGGLSVPGGGGARFTTRRAVGGPGAETQQTAKDLLSDVKTNVGASFILEGLAAVVLIGALGSAIPAFAISKIRPAEVMRGE